MCEIEGKAMDAATQSNLRVINTTFSNVANIFDAAIKREREKQAKCRASTNGKERTPEDAA